MLYDPAKTQSESDRDTAFNEAFNTSLSRWEWLEEPITLPDGTLEPKPDLEMFAQAMLGGGRAQGPPLYVGKSNSCHG